MSAALVMQHAKRMRRIMLSFIACLALPGLFTLSRNLYDFRENVTEHKMCFYVLLLLLCILIDCFNNCNFSKLK